MANETKILAVDDEPLNLHILQQYLSSHGYGVDTATDGVEAWELLQKQHNHYSVILLDRMMPNMDGMQLLEKINENHSIKQIPVVMQTAAAEKSQIIEGINAGVYHYLTKPFEEELLLSIVEAAARDYETVRQLQEEATQQKNIVGLIKNCEFELQTLDQAKDLAMLLSACYPNPEKVVVGISELLVNGIEHGNLGISYEEKSDLNQSNNWREEVNRRLVLPENQAKTLKVFYKKEKDKINLLIKDEGVGFEWQDYLELSASRACDNHGRGIALSRKMSFNEVNYNQVGNEVTAVVYLQ